MEKRRIFERTSTQPCVGFVFGRFIFEFFASTLHVPSYKHIDDRPLLLLLLYPVIREHERIKK